MSLRENHSDLISQFLARGGRIQKVPDAVPISRRGLIEYLRQQKLSVRPLATDYPRVRRYLCAGEHANLQRLLSIANRLRSEQGLPPFQLDTVLFRI